jgi:hypothetical protein
MAMPVTVFIHINFLYQTNLHFYSRPNIRDIDPQNHPYAISFRIFKIIPIYMQHVV